MSTKKKLYACVRFTLIELLVVIAIIAILAAMLMPALESARTAAHRMTCTGRMRQQALAFQMYSNTNDGWWPYTGSHRFGLYSNVTQIRDLVNNYTGGSFTTWVCPDARKKDGSGVAQSEYEDYVTQSNYDGKGSGGGGFYYAGLGQVTGDSGNYMYAAGEPMRWCGAPSAESCNGYAFRDAAVSASMEWKWGIKAAANTMLRGANGVVAGEAMGCPRTYSQVDPFWSQGGAFRHGSGSEGMFPGGNVMRADGSVSWSSRSDGFGAYINSGNSCIITFFSTPWDHWYRYNRGAKYHLPAMYSDYE